MTLRQFVAILHGRWRLALAAMSIVVAAAVATSLALPERYTATAQVLVELGSLDPATGIVLPGPMPAGHMATQVDIATSQKVALMVVDALRIAEDPRAIERWRRDTGGHGSIRHHQADLLFEGLRVRPARESSVLDIAYTGEDPAFSAAVANAFARAYVDTIAQIGEEPEKRARGRMEAQEQALRDRLEAARSRLSAHRREHGIVADAGAHDTENARLAALTARLAALQGRERGADGDPLVVDGGGPPSRQEAELQAAIERQRARVLRIEQVREELAALQQDVESALRSHERVAARLGQASAEARIPRADGVLLNPAVEPVRPSSPRLMLNTAASIGVGGVLGVAAALAAERRRRRIRSPSDLGAATAVPVMGVLRDRHARPSGPWRPLVPSRASALLGRGGPGGQRPVDGVEPRGIAPGPLDAPLDDEPLTLPLPPARASGVDVAPPFDAGGTPRAESAMLPSGTAAATVARRQPLGRIMVEAGMIQEPAVERILAWARQEGVRFGEAAVRSRLATEAQVRKALAYQFDHPVLEPGSRGVSEELVAAFGSNHPVVADLRRLRSQIHARQADRSGAHGHRSLRTIAVVSPGTGEGKTFVAANLAVTFSQMGQRTLLIDGDLAAGRIHELFGFDNRTGLSAMLNGRILPGAIRRVEGLRDLTVITSGGEAPNATDLLSRETFEHLLDAFRRLYDVILIDTPAAAGDADAELISRRAGACVIVAREGRSDFDAVHGLKAELESFDVSVIGSVLIRA